MENKLITLRNVEIRFPNFAGKAKGNNSEGDRNFTLLLDPEMAVFFKSKGCTVKEWKPDADTIIYSIKVKLHYGNDTHPDPLVVLITSENETELDQTTIEILDKEPPVNIDLTIELGYWARNGKSGVTPYLRTMFYTMEEDDLVIERNRRRKVLKTEN